MLYTGPLANDVKTALIKWKQSLLPINNVNSAETFDAYFARRGKFYKLKKLANSAMKSPFVHFSCSCPAYNKGAFCKHSIGLGIMKHVFKVPVECCIENLGAEKKDRTQKKSNRHSL